MQIHNFALISIKEARRLCLELATATIIESQEVPRTTDRANGRTIFLWHLDWTKAYATLSRAVLQQIGNLMTRRESEIAAEIVLIKKSQRSDVQADPSLLKKEEWDALKALDARKLALGAAIQRTDSDYLLLNLPENEQQTEVIHMAK